MSYASMLVLELQGLVRALAYDLHDVGRTESIHARIESEDGAWSASSDVDVGNASSRIQDLIAKAIESKHGPRFRFVVFADTTEFAPDYRRTRNVLLAGTS